MLCVLCKCCHVSHMVQDVQPTEDFILVIDADMIMRQPFDPVALGAGPGWAISAFFTYMKGVSNELAMRHVPHVVPRTDNLAGQPGRRGDQVGGFTLMNTKDLERVAPMWLSFTTAVRNDPTVSVHTKLKYSVCFLHVSACMGHSSTGCPATVFASGLHCWVSECYAQCSLQCGSFTLAVWLYDTTSSHCCCSNVRPCKMCRVFRVFACTASDGSSLL